MTSGRSVNSTSKEWGTPKKYVDAVKDVFGGEIDLDPCSNKYSIVNAKIEYLLPKNDGLKDSWNEDRIYVNPPYGNDKERGTNIDDWLHRCALANEVHNSEVIALLPTAANTKTWKNNIWGKARMICFLYDTRLKFLENGKDTGKGSPIQNCIVYWGTHYASKFNEVFLNHGAVVDISDLQDREKIGGLKRLSMSRIDKDKLERKRMQDFLRLSKDELISICEQGGIPTHGTKKQLCERLIN
jgi:hypothetical protein